MGDGTTYNYVASWRPCERDSRRFFSAGLTNVGAIPTRRDAASLRCLGSMLREVCVRDGLPSLVLLYDTS